MLVIVGHGPSIVGKGLGPWLDKQRVVRLKGAPIPNASDWGTRTDVICASSLLYKRDSCLFWFFPKQRGLKDSAGVRVANSGMWREWFRGFSSTKGPSTGLAAILCALEFEKPDEIGLVGFDNLLYPERKNTKWFNPDRPGVHHWDADSEAENAAVKTLNIKIVDVTCPTFLKSIPSAESVPTSGGARTSSTMK